MSPTQRTLKRLRELGYIAEVVEKWIPGANIRKDLFGCIDIVALGNGRTLGVQATSAPNHAARVKKAMASKLLKTWCECGNLFEVWSWEKGVREPRTTEVHFADEPANPARAEGDRILPQVPLGIMQRR